MRYAFAAALEQLPSANAYFVVYLPLPVAAEIDQVSQGLRGGFGSVRVDATVGATQWRTSIFKDARRSSYLMLVKKDVRQKEKLQPGDELQLILELVDF